MANTPGIRSQEPARLRYSRAFRPLFCWLAISAGILASDYHRKQAPRTTLDFQVRIEGQTIANPSSYSATLGERRVTAGSVAPIGQRKLRVAVADAEPVERKVFVWYGENRPDAAIDLKWKRGLLDLKIEPEAKLVRVQGPHHSFSLTNSSGTGVSIPVGTYRVEAVFEHLAEEQEVRVEHNQTHRILLKPKIGALMVSTEPAGAEFQLFNEGRNAISTKGTTPALLPGLPEGIYHLRVWRDDYLKEIPFDVRKWETNSASIAFEYGEITLSSNPAEATIFNGERDLGRTPKTLSRLKPGSYRFRLEKPGYASTELNLEVSGTNSITVTTNLLNVRYAEAIANATREAAGLSPDYRSAMANVELALKEKPGDPAALSLKSELELALQGLEKREAQEKEAAELDGRKRFASYRFDRAVAEFRQAELFETHRWDFQAEFSKVHDGLLRAFNKSAAKWGVEKETPLDPRTVVFFCKPKGIFVLGRHSVVLATQVNPNEVQVYAKFWDYVVGNKVSVSIFKGISEDSLIPVHKDYFPPAELPAIEKRRRDIAADLYNNLQNELR